ncbi:MAG: hypothetical protein ACTSX4_14090 [Candidatus Helarchaeota archaeon]
MEEKKLIDVTRYIKIQQNDEQVIEKNYKHPTPIYIEFKEINSNYLDVYYKNLSFPHAMIYIAISLAIILPITGFLLIFFLNFRLESIIFASFFACFLIFIISLDYRFRTNEFIFDKEDGVFMLIKSYLGIRRTSQHELDQIKTLVLNKFLNNYYIYVELKDLKMIKLYDTSDTTEALDFCNEINKFLGFEPISSIP